MSPIMANSKDGHGHKDKYIDLVTRNIMKALALTVQKLIARLKFSKNGSNSKVKVTVSKTMVSTKRSYQREYSC